MYQQPRWYIRAGRVAVQHQDNNWDWFVWLDGEWHWVGTTAALGEATVATL
jgi:hypothetical protein